jgi:hypothetical protein
MGLDMYLYRVKRGIGHIHGCLETKVPLGMCTTITNVLQKVTITERRINVDMFNLKSRQKFYLQ